MNTNIELVKTTINGEFEIILPKHRADRPEWYDKEGWEKKRLQSLHENITNKDIIFYVGAEEGDMAALCQMWGAKVVLFEPNDKVWPNMKLIWKFNNLKNPLMCFSGFASSVDNNEAEGLYLGRFPDSADGEVISDHGFKNLDEAGELPQTTIDSLISLTRVVPTIISIDVEGSEWEVLKGAEKVLRETHPKIYLSLHPEFMYEKYQKYSADLRTWIKELGYKEELLAYDHEVHLVYTKNE